MVLYLTYNLIFIFFLIVLTTSQKGKYDEITNTSLKTNDKRIKISAIFEQDRIIRRSILSDGNIYSLFIVVRNAMLTDLMRCKLTQKGMEYRGTIAKTSGGIRCQSWYAEEPIHEVAFI